MLSTESKGVTREKTNTSYGITIQKKADRRVHMSRLTTFIERLNKCIQFRCSGHIQGNSNFNISHSHNNFILDIILLNKYYNRSNSWN